MSKIVCQLVEGVCVWPDCECTWENPVVAAALAATKPAPPLPPVGMPAPPERKPYTGKDAVFRPKVMQFVSTIHKIGPLHPNEIMYEGSRHQTPDATKFRKVLSDVFGSLAGQPRKVIPIVPAKMINEIGEVFDVDILQIMIAEVGGLCGRTPDEPYWTLTLPQLAKLAEALNNLPD